MKKLTLLIILLISCSYLFAQEPVKTPIDTAKYELEYRKLVDAQAKVFYISQPIEIEPTQVTIKGTTQKLWIKEIPGNTTKKENKYSYSDQDRDTYIKQQEEIKNKKK